jgi:hypothetical protein
MGARCKTTEEVARISAHTTERRRKMTKMKTLSAVIILSATIATPVFAQPTHHGRSYDGHRGSYNQLNEPFYAPLQTQDERNIQNFGFSGRDRSWVGGVDPSLRPSGS